MRCENRRIGTSVCHMTTLFGHMTILGWASWFRATLTAAVSRYYGHCLLELVGATLTAVCL